MEIKYKKGEILITYDDVFWGPKYSRTGVVVVQEKHPMYSVQCFDNTVCTVPYRALISFDEYYNSESYDFQAAGRASFHTPEGDATGVPDIPLPECNCDSLDLFRYGCKCGGK